jgi:CRP-like cAMP-binding protein
MDYFDIPGDIQYRIQRHFDYLWLNQRAFGQIMLLQDSGLSDTLRMEISIHLYKDVVARVPYFKKVGRVLLGKITMAIKTKVYLPDDTIIYKGDFGMEMYIIRRGTVQIVDSAIQLSEGAFFGEMALVMHLRRNATVKALNMCDLCVLHKDDFDEILIENIEFAENMKDMVVTRQVQQLNVTDDIQREKLTTELHVMCDEQLRVKKRMSMERIASFHQQATTLKNNMPNPAMEETKRNSQLKSNSNPGLQQRKTSFVIKGGQVTLNSIAEPVNDLKHEKTEVYPKLSKRSEDCGESDGSDSDSDDDEVAEWDLSDKVLIGGPPLPGKDGDAGEVGALEEEISQLCGRLGKLTKRLSRIRKQKSR